MRPGEASCQITLLVFIVIGWLERLGRREQQQLLVLGLIGSAPIIAVQLLSSRYPETAQVAGDWLPAFLILVVYWQSGRFNKSSSQKLQDWLESFDRRSIGGLLRCWEHKWRTTWLATYLELSYLLCSPLVLLGVGTLYLANRRSEVDSYWATVLPATFLCYLVLPFAATLPPRLIHKPLPAGSKLQSLNRYILRHASIQLNTFPSAHVASSFACALVLLRAVPPVGIVFLILSISIAAGAVLGRYHYLADTILGALLPLLISLVSLR